MKRSLTRTLTLTAWAALGPLLLVNCTSDPGDEDEQEEEGCSRDSDCNEGRICEENECVSPNGSTVATSGGPSSGAGGQTTTASSSSSSSSSGAGGATTVLTVNNNSSVSMFYFYASPCGADSWSDDLFGAEVLLSGYAATFQEFPSGCWDFVAVAEDQSQWQWYNQNLAPYGSHAITGSD